MPITYPSRLSYLLSVAIFGYLVIGVFPMTLLEVDATGVLAGCKQILETGQFGENAYTYYFQSQPGIYAWVLGFQWLTHLSLIDAYSLVSALFGLLFVVLSAYWLSRLLQAGFAASLFCLLLFQEIYSACFYMNSATGAAFFLMAALCLIYQKNTTVRLVSSGLLLALAAWTRADVMITFPVVALLVKADNPRQRFRLTAILFIAFVAAFTALYWGSNAHNGLQEIAQGGSSLSFADNQETAVSFASSQFMRVLIGYFSGLTVLLIGYGIWLLIRDRRWQLLSICLLPIGGFMLLLGARLVAGKHLLYYTPFFAIPVLVSCQQLYEEGFRRKRVLFKTLLAGALLQYVVGVQIAFAAYPYSNEPYASTRPYPTFGKLASVRWQNAAIDSLQVVIGGGTQLATSDELLLSSGMVFAPLTWSHLKQDSQADYVAIDEYLTSFSGDTLHITTSQGSAYPIKNMLFLRGYQLLKAGSVAYPGSAVYQWTWCKNGRVVLVDQSLFPKDSYKAYVQKLSNTPYSSYLHLAFWDWERWFLHRYNRHTDSLRHVGYVFDKPITRPANRHL